MKRDLIDSYLQKPYTIEIIPEEKIGSEGYFARVVELPGCMTQADDFQELETMIKDAMRAWIETSLENGQDIPEPKRIQEYSGKFLLRIPKSLHRELVYLSEKESVSLNSFITTILARSVGLIEGERLAKNEIGKYVAKRVDSNMYIHED
jgi:antitoxin HicB